MYIGEGQDNTNYVSWYLKPGTTDQGDIWRTYHFDMADEGGKPNRVYAIENSPLQLDPMRKEWARINDSKRLLDDATRGAAAANRPTYRIGNRNCSQVVFMVLNAGGVSGMVDAKLLNNNELWTPDRINDLCKALVEKKLAKRVEAHTRWLPKAFADAGASLLTKIGR